MRQTRVLVADDNEGFGATLGRFVAVHRDMLVVGRAFDGREAVSMTESLSPDVVLMDLFMPGMDGFEATRILSHTHPDVSVVALTAQRSADSERMSLEAGARAFVPKIDADMRLIELIRSLASSNSRGEGVIGETTNGGTRPSGSVK
ncbi:MAG: response regulator transcription factor [Actinomycetota bacterium]|nr:response regulator transcription factor [Actinomycetota bacterium]